MIKKWVIGVLCVLLLTGCGEKTTVKDVEESVETTAVEAADAEELSKKTEDIEDSEMEDDADIPEVEELISGINKVLQEKGMSDPIAFENVEYSLEEVAGIIRISISIDGNNGKPLNVFCTKDGYDDWYIASISNRNTGNVYWTDESNLEFTDLYDYETDELIQEKEHSYEEVLEEIRSEGEKEINELLEKQEEIKKQAEDLAN